MNRAQKRPRPEWGTEATNGQDTHSHSTPPPSRPAPVPVEPIADRQPDAAGELPEPVTLTDALQKLIRLLPGLQRALEFQAARDDRMALKLPEVADRLGIGRRVLERLRSAGRFPKPDIKVGKVSRWTPETIRRWIREGGSHET